MQNQTHSYIEVLIRCMPSSTDQETILSDSMLRLNTSLQGVKASATLHGWC